MSPTDRLEPQTSHPIPPVVIAAAGRGRRIGGPKALLSYEGEPLAVRVARTFVEAGCPRVVVVVGAGADAVEAALGPLPRVTTVRADPDAPMLASVLAGLAAAPEADALGVLVHAVDAPRVTAATVRRLLAARGAEPDADGLVAACGGRRGHPLWLAPRRVAELRGATADHPDGLRGWSRARGLRIVPVETNDATVLDDVDTPEQLALLRSGAGGGTGP
ncbi:MAG: NTP transferase domain-containing protein [Deltaproteobacteria bacterium]|nr:NTP transferase domain-containing protein [Deltaproteobacteria bacterium]